MEYTIVNSEQSLDEIKGHKAVKEAGALLNLVLDTSTVTATLFNMTPIDGYQKKLDIISQAEDMPTKEKLQAISQAEDKYAYDIRRNAELFIDISWMKAGIIITVCVGSIFILKSQEGQNMVKNVLKKVV